MNAVKFCLCFLLLIAPLVRADSILVLGDSLSAAYRIEKEQGWVDLLATRLDGHQIINASVSGETSGGGLSRLPRLLEEIKPDWVLIELGGNDGLRGYPIQSIRSNLSAIIEAAQAVGAKPIVMEIRIPPNYGERYSLAFQQVYGDLSDAFGVPFIEFILQEIALNPTLMQDDGIHPTAEAQPMIAQLVAQDLQALLSDG